MSIESVYGTLIGAVFAYKAIHHIFSLFFGSDYIMKSFVNLHKFLLSIPWNYGYFFG